MVPSIIDVWGYDGEFCSSSLLLLYMLPQYTGRYNDIVDCMNTVCTVANGSVCVYRRGSVYPTSKISTCVLMFKGSFVDNVPVSSMLLHSPNNTCATVVASGQLSFQDTLCFGSGRLPLKTLFDLNPVLKINFIAAAHHVV